jgi:sigma-70-like protein
MHAGLHESKSWPRSGYPILPMIYREAWFYEKLPAVALSKAGLPDGLTMGNLGTDLWNSSTDEYGIRVLTNHIIALVRARLYFGAEQELANQPVLGGEWRSNLDPRELPFAVRTINVLDRAGKLQDIQWLSRASAIDIFALPHAGPLTLLDFATVAEAHNAVVHTAQSADNGDNRYDDLRRQLYTLSSEFPIDSISTRHQRLRHLQLRGPSVKDGLESLIETSKLASRDQYRQLSAQLAEVRTAISELSSETLDESFMRVLHSLLPLRQVPAIAARLGWDGRGGCTLQEAGDLLGVSRERVRQLEQKVSKEFRHHSFFPGLDRALDALERFAKTMEPNSDELLFESGITKRPFMPSGVITAATLLGRPPRLELSPDRRSVQLPGDEQLLPFRLVFKSLSDVNYVAPVAEFEARVRDISDGATTPAMVRSFLDRYDNVVWLDSEHNWFWIQQKEGRNRYVNAAKKILSVTNGVAIETLREGVLRHHRTRRMSLPRTIFEAFCRAAGFQNQNGIVSYPRPLDFTEELAPIEQAFVRILRDCESVASTGELRDRCLAAGVNRHSFFVYLSYSPVIERIADGVYGLRGSQIDPARVAHILGNYVRPERALQDNGWTKDGAIWLGYNVTKNLRDTSVINVPASVAKILGERRYDLLATDGSNVGHLSIRKFNAWGFGPFMNRRGVDVGDTLIITVDTDLEVAVIQSGSAELLASYQDGDGWGPRRVLEEVTAPSEVE